MRYRLSHLQMRMVGQWRLKLFFSARVRFIRYEETEEGVGVQMNVMLLFTLIPTYTSAIIVLTYSSTALRANVWSVTGSTRC